MTDVITHIPSSSDSGLCWFALHTFRNGRKSVERDLCRDEVEYYRPEKVEREYVGHGREVQRRSLIFPSLLFIRSTLEYVERIQHDPESLAYPYVTPGTRCPAGISDREMEIFRFALENGGDRIDPIDERLAAGDRVRVTGGPMCGAEGYIVRVHGTRRLVVAIEESWPLLRPSSQGGC